VKNAKNLYGCRVKETRGGIAADDGYGASSSNALSACAAMTINVDNLVGAQSRETKFLIKIKLFSAGGLWHGDCAAYGCRGGLPTMESRNGCPVRTGQNGRGCAVLKLIGRMR
jgi:hypothetical protein